MADRDLSPTRYAPAEPLPPYSYVPGHDLPHPVNDPAGHLYAHRDQPHEPPISPDVLASLPTDPASRRRTLATLLTGNSQWRHALDLFNEGFYWESHEAWESFWNALGRTTPEAIFVQALIHLAAACVKVREGKPEDVTARAKPLKEPQARSWLPLFMLALNVSRVVRNHALVRTMPMALRESLNEIAERYPVSDCSGPRVTDGDGAVGFEGP